ncbi:hypothetical protein RF11_00700 [Thelohanellus kitauei]|uniref:Uncharacterized protein n=1 Tax=Thelohanellus kitauei TaxID=669202 RepID=A0A0C2NKX7_THEKT|nr:hypothetical protein RF11_00700 [Thelohanellus kitauei]
MQSEHFHEYSTSGKEMFIGLGAFSKLLPGLLLFHGEGHTINIIRGQNQNEDTSKKFIWSPRKCKKRFHITLEKSTFRTSNDCKQISCSPVLVGMIISKNGIVFENWE